MEIKSIKQMIAIIKKEVKDDEVAHGLEDELMTLFIESIAAGENDNLSKKAKLILSVKKLDFARWCA